MSSNLQKQILKEGSGNTPQQGTQVSVHYTGYLTNGQIFDSSRNRGQPFSFTLGVGQVIRGWDLCVASMKQGEMCRLTCPPEYGYGDHAMGPIPANSTLIFEIEML